MGLESLREQWEKELETYERERARLLAHEGKYAVIHGDEVAPEFWDTYEDALWYGFKLHGRKTFMVRQIQAVDQVQFVTPNLPKCPP